MAEKVKKLSAICRDCFETACFTVRNGSEETEVNMVGGEELYKPVCRGCYYKFLERGEVKEWREIIN